MHVFHRVPKVFTNESTICTCPLARNFMQIGGCTLKMLSIDDGRAHIPSPHIKPAATADDNNSAFFLFILPQMINKTLPRVISML